MTLTHQTHTYIHIVPIDSWMYCIIMYFLKLVCVQRLLKGQFTQKSKIHNFPLTYSLMYPI